MVQAVSNRYMAVKASATFSCTRKRVGEMHTCPALRNLAPPAVFTASATSASSATITGAWPPSSMVARFMC